MGLVAVHSALEAWQQDWQALPASIHSIFDDMTFSLGIVWFACAGSRRHYPAKILTRFLFLLVSGGGSVSMGVGCVVAEVIAM
jgi:hypothetical protein